MAYRSTNPLGYTHHGGDLIAGARGGVDGIRLAAVSTGSSAVLIESVGDGDASIPISIVPKSTGLLSLGSTQTRVQIGNSTSGFAGIEIVRIDYTPPALAASANELVGTASTHAQFTTSASYMFTPQTTLPSTNYSIGAISCSTQGDLRLHISNAASTIGTGESTQHGNIIVFK